MQLTPQDGRLLLDVGRRCAERLRDEHGLTLETSVDADAMMRAWSLIRDRTNLTWTFHPDHSVLDGRNFFWSQLLDPEGRTAAINIQRMFETEDFVEDFRMGVMFADGAPRLDIDEPPLLDNDALPALNGRIGFSGAHWVAPELRRRGISTLYSPLGQALSLRKFRWQNFVILQRIEADGRGGFDRPKPNAFRFANSEPFFSGIYQPHGEDINLALCWKSGAELLCDLASRIDAGEF